MKRESSTPLSEWLKALPDPSESHDPTLFELDRSEDRSRLVQLLSEKSLRLARRDTIHEQVAALLEVENPSASISADDAREYVARHGGEHYGVWVYYPWLELLIRTLPKAEFRTLRAARNRFKITALEQETLHGACIGIVGLSAGHAIATCLALEGIGGTLRLADFDAVELTNTNRVPCGLPGLGLNKAVLAARRVVEIDPYVRVEVYAKGLHEDNLDAFLASDRRLDLLIEECDDLWLKVRLREEARRRRIPVVMETNDRGLLDIERFDLEPDRPILHGLLGDTSSAELVGLELDQKTPFLLEVIGSRLSPRAAASLIEIKRSITGWPQLGSGTTLGGAVVTDTARRILLKELNRSGRHYVDLEAIVQDRAEAPRTETVSASVASPSPKLPHGASGEPSRDELRRLVERAMTAPSGGNAQPWRFVGSEGRLDLFLDRSRAGALLDFQCASSYLALGSAAEALVHAATAAGREAELVPFPNPAEPDLVYRIGLAPRSRTLPPSELASVLEARCTNRRLGERRPLEEAHAAALVEAARSCEAELELVTAPDALHELGGVLGEIDRLRLLSETLHADVMKELRFTEAEARESGDGIDLATLELDPVGKAAFRLLRDPAVCAVLRKLDKGARLVAPARQSVDAASALGLVTVPGTDARAYVRGGHAVLRIWLVATQLGLSFQPMSVAPYLFARLERGDGEGLTLRERSALTGLRQRFSKVFAQRGNHAEVLLFRIARVAPPGVRSLRRPVDNVLFWD